MRRDSFVCSIAPIFGRLCFRNSRSWAHLHRINATDRARLIAKCEGIFALKGEQGLPDTPLPFGIGGAERVGAQLYRRRETVCVSAEKRGVCQLRETRGAKGRIACRSEQRRRKRTDF